MRILKDATAHLLGKRFWYLKRSVDIEGADFLVQLRADSFEAIESRRPEIFVLGIVQSKFVQRGTTTHVSRTYCVNTDGEPLEQFFVMCHTLDEDEETHTYFFTAAEIIGMWPYDPKRDAYSFYLGAADQYADRKDLKAGKVLDAIQDGIQKAKADKNNRYIQQLFFHTIDAGRNYGARHFYLLRHIEDVAVCIVENASNGVTYLLEPRRDIFPNAGGYSWGYEGTGVRFLAWCILSHMKDGATPDREEVQFIVSWLLACLSKDESWDIPSEFIRALLGGLVPSTGDTRQICSSSNSSKARQARFAPEKLMTEFHKLNELLGLQINNLDKIAGFKDI